MKMMSSKVLKELRIENERLQKHLAAVTQDVGPPRSLENLLLSLDSVAQSLQKHGLCPTHALSSTPLDAHRKITYRPKEAN